jgi:hypothetical protein
MIETAYLRAVRADPFNARILRSLDTFYECFDKHGSGERLSSCPLCLAGFHCEVCKLHAAWCAGTPMEMKWPLGPRLPLADVAEAVLRQEPPFVPEPKPLPPPKCAELHKRVATLKFKIRMALRRRNKRQLRLMKQMQAARDDVLKRDEVEMRRKKRERERERRRREQGEDEEDIM